MRSGLSGNEDRASQKFKACCIPCVSSNGEESSPHPAAGQCAHRAINDYTAASHAPAIARKRSNSIVCRITVNMNFASFHSTRKPISYRSFDKKFPSPHLLS
jgi:hypothetical protein